MITLNQVIKVLHLQDYESVWLVDDVRKSVVEGILISVKKIKETADLNKVYVTHIDLKFDRYDGEFMGFKFVIRDRRN